MRRERGSVPLDQRSCPTNPVVADECGEARLDLGFGVEVDETLRLRGIDAPELSRQSGVRAREYVRGAERVGAGGDRDSTPR